MSDDNINSAPSDPMPPARDYTEEQLAELIGALPPAPAAWIRGAQELPAARRAMDDLVKDAQAAGKQRDAIFVNLEDSLRQAGVEPRRELVEELRSRLSDASQ
jgi:hypothetical protein